MARTVIVLGAGGSRDADGPLMADFIARAHALWRVNQAAWAQESFDRVFAARAQLQRASAKANPNIDNIEHLFSAFEMSRLLGRLGAISPKDLDLLVDAMKHVITRTLEKTVKWGITDEDVLIPPSPYEAFTHFAAQLHESQLYGPVALVTFNYDLALDYGLAYGGLEADYCLTDRAPATNTIPLLKLHGSLNWYDPAGNGNIVALQLKPLSKTKLPTWGSFELTTIDTSVLLQVPEFWKTGKPPTAVIVPPTWSKSEYQRKLLNVWRHAADAISEAENFIMIGYSLPETDQFFRDFYGLSSISDTVMNRFCIVNPVDCVSRFRAVVGEAVMGRGRVELYQKVFTGALPELANKFDLKTQRVHKICTRDENTRFGNKDEAKRLTHELRNLKEETF